MEIVYLFIKDYIKFKNRNLNFDIKYENGYNNTPESKLFFFKINCKRLLHRRNFFRYPLKKIILKKRYYE